MSVPDAPPSLSKEEAIVLLREHAFLDAEPGAVGRSIIHCFMGMIGADWNLDEAVALVESSDDRAWVDSPFLHNLAVLAGGRVYTFDVPKPKIASAVAATEGAHLTAGAVPDGQPARPGSAASPDAPEAEPGTAGRAPLDPEEG